MNEYNRRLQEEDQYRMKKENERMNKMKII